ncbi:MAG: glycosyltransferase [Planctomycetota bacterium]
MKILHLLSNLRENDGANTACCRMAQQQAEAGLAVTLASATPPPADATMVPRAAAAGVDVQSLPLNAAGQRDSADAFSVWIKPLLETHDVLHVHGLWDGVQAQSAKLAGQLGRPHVLSPHGMLTTWSLNQKRLKKLIYRKLQLGPLIRNAHGLHFTTEQERDDSPTAHAADRSLIIPLGQDVDAIVDAAEQPWDDPRNDPGRPTVAVMGRVCPGKGIEHLIAAMVSIKPADARLLVIGPNDNPFGEDMQALADNCGVADNVVFTGPLAPPTLYAALASADVFCLPSDHENFSLAAVEAMACGTATLVSAHVGIADALSAERAGAIVSQNPAELAQSLSDWLADQTGRQRLAETGRAFVRRRYDKAIVAQQWADAYAKITA